MNASSELLYTKIFDPPRLHRPDKGKIGEPADQRQYPVYVYTDEIILAVNVALATGRPLLVRGSSGSGKSSLAPNVGDYLGWRYYEKVITSRTQANDLLWEIDWLRRLHDAQNRDIPLTTDYTPYVVPGVLWWAFDRESAKNQGGKFKEEEGFLADPCTVDHPRAVVLLDEIDKADPDVPNNLLVPLGSLQFQVQETGVCVATARQNAPLIVITTNEERELPKAFLRRCVEVELPLPGRSRLIEIAQAHFPETGTETIEQLADALFGSEQETAILDVSPAEFIDTLQAYRELGIRPGTFTWDKVVGITVWKHGRTKGTPS